MQFFNEHFLSLFVFFPFVWAVIGLFFPTQKKDESSGAVFKYWALVGSTLTFILALFLLYHYSPSGEEFQLIEKSSWIPMAGIQYYLGVDGISIWLILLTTFLFPLVILASFTAIHSREKEYYFLLNALMSGILGSFVSLDLFLFYIFWEAMLIPMYFLVGIWGGKDRIYAAMKLFLYTVSGSVLMLVAIFYLSYLHFLQFGALSTSLTDLLKLQIGSGGFWSAQSLMFLAFSISFAIKVPLFPLHTWLPDAHVQAPTAGSVILAGILLKLGGYGFLRFAFPLFPEAVHYYQNIFLTLGSVAIIYGAWVAMVQPDMKKLVAYSSVSHMGYVIVGLFSLNMIGITGSIYQMLNHGISTGALFLLVGMIYERTHTREISDYGGIAKIVPLFSVIFLIATLSSIALPATNGFIGEFLILLGAWISKPWVAVVCATGVIFGAVYMLWLFQRVVLGPITHKENEKLKDLNGRELFVLAPFVLLIFIMGLAPNYFFQKMEPSIERLLTRVSLEKKIQEPTPAEAPEVEEQKKEEVAPPAAAEGAYLLDKEHKEKGRFIRHDIT